MDPAAMTCYSTEDPRARNATQLISLTDDNGALWRSRDAPICPCSSSSLPAARRCLLCVDEAVRVLCRDLTAGARLALEALGAEVKLTSSDCPTLGSHDAAHWKLPVIIVSVLILICIFILVAAAFRVYKKCNNNNNNNNNNKRRSANMEEEGEEGDSLKKPEDTGNGDPIIL